MAANASANANEIDDDQTTDEARVTARQAEMAAGDDEGLDPKELAARLRAEKAERERIAKELKESNRKATADRKFREEFEAAEADRKAAQMTEAERTKKAAEETGRRLRETEAERDTLRGEITRLRVDAAVERQARVGGWRNPELATKLIDRDRIEIDAETGLIDAKTVKDAIDRVTKEYPDLAESERRGGGSPAAKPPRRPPVGDGNGGTTYRQRQIDPHEQELIEMRGSGPM